MAKIIQVTDFEGRYQIGSNAFLDDKYQDYLDAYEQQYLTLLLGVELYDLFISDLDGNGVPATPIYQAIYDKFSYDVNGCIVMSGGIKELLKGFIFFEIMRKADSQRTIAGNTRNFSDNSDNISQLEAGLWLFYNGSVDNHYSIQWFICDNIADYPTYNGQKISKISWL